MQPWGYVFLMGMACFTGPGRLRAQDAPAVNASNPAETEAGLEPAVERLPRLKELPVPSAEELLTQAPRDWIVLTNDDVLIVNPMTPRPDTLALRQQELAIKFEARKKVLGEKREKLDQEIEELNTFVVTLPDGPDRKEFRLPVRLVKQFMHYEDLLLQRIDLLLQEQTPNLDLAYELLTRLQRNRPDWDGIPQMGLKLLLLEIGQRRQAEDFESAWALLEEAFRRAPQTPELPALTGAVVQHIVEAALQNGEFIQAQYYLGQLHQRFPEHAVYRKFSEELDQQARAQMQLAVQASQAQDVRGAVLAAEQAVAIWPLHQDFRQPYGNFAERYQRLHVGVVDLPGECLAYPVRSPADERRRSLTELPLFEMDRIRDGTAYYRTRFFEEWEPSDLGREMRFRLKQYHQPHDTTARVTAWDLADTLRIRLDPESPHFDERLSTFVGGVDVQSPTELKLKFRRVPPRVEPLLAEIAIRPSAIMDKAGSSLQSPVGFQLFSQSAELCEYVRAIPEPVSQSQPHVAAIVEHRYSSPEKLIQGLRRGEVSMASGLPDVELRTLQADVEFTRAFFIQPCLLPQTHLLQLNPASVPLQIPELRKGLASAIDGDHLLKEVVLQDPRARHGRLVTVPFSSKSPARNVTIQPRRFDLSNAFALILAARQKSKHEIPPLTMIVSPDPMAMKVTTEIVKNWRRVGLEINIVGAGDPPPSTWDILYRTLEIQEPVLEMWPLLTFSNQADIEGLKAYPDWIRQELVRLDRIGDQSLAIDALQTLHRHLWEETAYIPLWEVDQFVILRKNIRGFPERFAHCYDQIDRWRVQPWYRESLP